MAVEKYVISRTSSNFTTIPNKVLQNLRDIESLGMYCYFVSLPPGWMFHKDQLRSHFKIGRDKVDYCLKVLQGHDLIKIDQIRNSKGQFSHFDLQVHDGTSFKIKGLEKTGSPLTEKPLTENQLLDNSTYKYNIDKNNNNKKEILKDIGQASLDRKTDDPILFENFWKAYPRKVKKKKSKLIWDKNKLYLLSEQIISNIQARIATEWNGKDLQYIPHPTTYLHNEQWNDEVLETTHDRRENSVTRDLRKRLERIKDYHTREVDAARVFTSQEDTACLDRPPVCPF